MTSWTKDPAADPSTTFAAPTQGSTPDYDWWKVLEKGLFDIQHLDADRCDTAIQHWTLKKKVTIQEMNDNRTTWS